MSLRRGYIYALIAALSYSIVAIFGKFALGAGIEPEVITFYQYLLTSGILFVYFLIKDRTKLKPSLDQLWRFAAIGVVGGMLSNFFYYHALTRLSAGLASMLLFSAPFLINLFFIVSGIRPIKPVFFIPIGLGLLGNFLALNVLGESLKLSTWGIFFGLMSAVFFAFYSIFMDLKVKDQDANQMNMFAALSGMVTSGIYNLVTQPQALLIPTESIVWMLLNAVFAGLIPVYFVYHSLQLIGSDKFSVLSTIELPLTLTMAFIFLNERLTPQQLAGMSLVVGSIVLLRMLELRANRIIARPDLLPPEPFDKVR